MKHLRPWRFHFLRHLRISHCFLAYLCNYRKFSLHRGVYVRYTTGKIFFFPPSLFTINDTLSTLQFDLELSVMTAPLTAETIFSFSLIVGPIYGTIIVRFLKALRGKVTDVSEFIG
ncbi:MAG: hypothetical protein NXY57DRAFT_1000653 [Lentinula lateritia]|nr:MAG: hypothetical protein NXY57DRAFT_1000653 [Lentinula lateritia]